MEDGSPSRDFPIEEFKRQRNGHGSRMTIKLLIRRTYDIDMGEILVRAQWRGYMTERERESKAGHNRRLQRDPGTRLGSR